MKTNNENSLQVLRDLVELLQKKIKRQNQRRLIDNTEVRNLLKVSDKTIYRLRKENKIPFRKIGKKYFYPLDFFLDVNYNLDEKRIK